MRNRKTILLALLILGATSLGASSDEAVAAAYPATKLPPTLSVVYPVDSQRVGPVDSMTIRGSVTPGAKLQINGTPIEVYRTGGFTAFLPVTPGGFVFRLRASNDHGYDTLSVAIRVAGETAIPPDSGILISEESVRPLWSRTVRAGDEINIGFQGTTGASARFWIISTVDTLGPFSMTELHRPALRNFDSFRDQLSRLPDSLPMAITTGENGGRYHGIWRVPDKLAADTLRVFIELIGGPEERDTSSVVATGGLLPIGSWPSRVVELTDSVQTLRMGPRLGYMTIFQPYGVRARYWGEVGPWTIIQPAPGYEAWIETEKTRLLPDGTPLPGSLIARLSTVADENSVKFVVGTTERLPFKVTVADDLHNVRVVVFGATSNTDWIAQDTADDLIEDISWTQTRPSVYEIALRLTEPVWGYDARYENGRLVVEFRRPPVVGRRLQGLTIAVDAGHSEDAGAIGPTGYMEKDANILIARALKRNLERKGADVIMTRRGSEDVPLYDRPAIAVGQGADLFISVHNNSVPDGVNPFARNGTGTYYYHAFSRDLAREVQHWTLDATALGDYGVTHGNFAVIRPTQYPSVLVECAFIILPDQEALLGTDEFANRIGRGITQGILRFVRERLGR